MRDWNYIAAMEKAISKKYGELSIINPKSNWTLEKEEEYKIQEKLLRKKFEQIEIIEEKKDAGGFLMSEKKDINRECKTCQTYSFKIEDDIFMNKYDCCNNCYILFIEGREDRWKSGWRPNR
jgi:hypothetical protein